jgi:tripartite-type tricarboxylate transporter receptor subunit TctC
MNTQKLHGATRRSLMASLLASLLGVCAMAPLASMAQSGGPIKLIVGYAAGGPVDAGARLLAPYLAKELGQTVIVENKPGAGGTTAGDFVVHTPPNGQVLYFSASPPMTISPHILKSMPFDPVKDLMPVAPLVSYTNVLVMNKDQPFKSLPELITYAKANPGKVSYGSAGIGASNHMSGELLALRTGTDLTHVPYKGNAPAMNDVMGGQITMMFDIVSTGRNYIQSGKVRGVAVTSRDRNASLPDTPSMRESGIADYDVGGWFGLFAPNKTAPETIAKLNEAVRKALANDELKAKLVEQGYDLWSGSPQILAERLSKELALWGTVAKGIPKQ